MVRVWPCGLVLGRCDSEWILLFFFIFFFFFFFRICVVEKRGGPDPLDPPLDPPLGRFIIVQGKFYFLI